MAPFFFILFYGIMMADMGYGIIMILAAVIAMKKMKPRAGSLSFCQLLLYCGIATFIMGAITGGFFGDALVKIGGILGKPEGWGELESLHPAQRYRLCPCRLDGARPYPSQHGSCHQLYQEDSTAR